MISITEIVLIVAGFAAIILGYLLPAGKDMDEEDRMLMEREIRELVRREVEDQKDTIENMIDDSVDNSLDRTERAMERISNEKMSAIGEYSDTVMNDIHKNHDEVMFMYDMLNDKHKNLTSVVSEVTRKTDEAIQAVRDAEATAKEAQQATFNLKQSKEEAVRAENVRAVLIDETDNRLSGIRIPYKETSHTIKENSGNDSFKAGIYTNVNSRDNYKESSYRENNYREPSNNQPSYREESYDSSGYVAEKDIKELHEIPVEYITPDQAGSLHVIGNKNVDQDAPMPIQQSAKVVPITEAVRAEGKIQNPDKTMQELTANDPISQNRQIIEMHKAGKSNMVIARELGLGIGEVKLVIDLSNKHRKVK